MILARITNRVGKRAKKTTAVVFVLHGDVPIALSKDQV